MEKSHQEDEMWKEGGKRGDQGAGGDGWDGWKGEGGRDQTKDSLFSCEFIRVLQMREFLSPDLLLDHWFLIPTTMQRRPHTK